MFFYLLIHWTHILLSACCILGLRLRARHMKNEKNGLVPYPNGVFYYCCCCSAQLCLTHCDPMNCSTPGLPVHHQLLEFTQTHVHWVSDAIPPSHPLSPPSLPAFNLSKLQGLSQWIDSASGGQSIEASGSASVLKVNVEGWFPWGLTDLISLLSQVLWRVFYGTTVQKHQFFGW